MFTANPHNSAAYNSIATMNLKKWIVMAICVDGTSEEYFFVNDAVLLGLLSDSW